MILFNMISLFYKKEGRRKQYSGYILILTGMVMLFIYMLHEFFFIPGFPEKEKQHVNTDEYTSDDIYNFSCANSPLLLKRSLTFK